ncbi:hypothetical protein Ancab_011743 [Ancistrocladus abbreviatus]
MVGNQVSELTAAKGLALFSLMRQVSGAVVCSRPVSLSKAAKILSKFASSDNGASPAFAAYLKRASASSNALVQLHKESKGSGFQPKGRRKYHSRDVSVGEAINRAEEDSSIEEGENGQGGEDIRIKKLSAEGDRRESDAIPKIQEDRRKRHKKKRDEDENGASKGSIVSVEGSGREKYVARGGSNRKKNEKRVSHDGIGGVVNKDEKYDVTGMKEDKIKDDLDSKRRIEEMKKKNRNEPEEGRSVGIIKGTEMNGQRHESGGATESEVTRNDMNIRGGEGKRQTKRNKGNEVEKREDGGIEEAEIRFKSCALDGTNNFMDVEGGSGLRHKNKLKNQGEERETHKVETVVGAEKESRKRTNKEVVDGDLDDSEEQHKSKKKKRKIERHD